MDVLLLLVFSITCQTLLTEASPLKFIPKSPENAVGGFFMASRWLYDSINKQYPKTFSSIECDVCEVIVKLLQDEVGKGVTDDEIVKLATKLCIVFKIEDDRICSNITKEFKDEFIYVLRNMVLAPSMVCGIVIGDVCGTPYDPWLLWNVSVPDIPKPPVTPPVPPKKGSPILRILHLTDIHGDPLYKEGSNVHCNEPLCCRKDDGPPAANTTGAGKWGAYGLCDIPYPTLENMFQHLSSIQNEPGSYRLGNRYTFEGSLSTQKDHRTATSTCQLSNIITSDCTTHCTNQFDMVYFTGDIPPHNVWHQTREDQLKALQYVTNLFVKYLPQKPVFHALGNHESSPVNSFPPPFVKGYDSIFWLYSALNESWRHWLPKNTTANIIKGAYYTVSPFPGFRIISLNMNYCNNQNWWLLVNSTDPAGQLRWFISVLQQAENNKEKVHIIGHISPGSNVCMKPFDWNYYKILNRYESTIVGQFFGHSHEDFFQVQYDAATKTRPIGNVYIPGSVTTYSNLNPGFRIYQVDGGYKHASWFTLNYQNYILDLEEANKSDKPKWTFEYDAKKDLELESLYPSDWHKLIYKMRDDDKLFQKWYLYQTKMVNPGPCDTKCKKSTLCWLKHGLAHYSNPKICQDL